MPGQNQFQKEQILRGIMTLLILRMLWEKPMHGYSLQTSISETIKRDMPQGTIYVLLKSLEKRGLIEIYETQGERDRKLYTITARGTKFLVGHEEPLSIAREIMDDLILFIGGMKEQSGNAD